MSDAITGDAAGNEALRRSTILERVTEGIVTLDADFRCTYVNGEAERILDAGREQLMGRCVWDVWPEMTETRARDEFEAALDTQAPHSFERYNSAREQWVEVRIYPDESGLSLYVRDVTGRKTPEASSTQATRWLTALVENTSLAVYVKDRKGRYRIMNEAAATLFGVEAEDVSGKRDEDLFDAEDASRMREIDEQILESEEPDSRETVRRVDGDERVFLDNKYPYYNEDGELVGLVGISRDITDRKQEQRTLERSRKHLQSLFERLPDSVIVHDAEGVVLDVNAQTVADLGYSREKLLAMNVTDFEAGLAADELRRIWAEMEVGDQVKTRSRLRREDGSTFPVEIWVNKVEIGDERRFIALGRDVTERHRQKRELEELTEEYRALLENAEDAIFLLDVEEGASGPEFRFERLNPYHEAATRLSAESARGKTPSEVFKSDFGAKLEADYRRCVEAGEPISYQETFQFPDGRRIWETKLAPVVIEGEVTRIIGIARDVTERVQREKQLRHQNERLDEFAGVVAHDLRNPLNIAQGRTTLAVEELEREGLESVHLTKAQKALGRMEDIIMDTLILARRGEEVESFESVSVAELAKRCWNMVETVEASLVVEDECTVEGDPDRLRHLFENLFRNAVEHGGEAVTVRVGPAGTSAFYVEDDGPGVPPDERETVFEPGQTSREEGTGFGLAIVKRIAKAHGWEVSLTEAAGGGARFEFRDAKIRS